jgi:hypothetical protein
MQIIAMKYSVAQTAGQLLEQIHKNMITRENQLLHKPGSNPIHEATWKKAQYTDRCCMELSAMYSKYRTYRILKNLGSLYFPQILGTKVPACNRNNRNL